MKPSATLSSALVLSLVLAVAATAAPPAKPARPGSGKGTINFERTKTRIDALLASRLKPEPLPDVLPNPFQLVEAAPTPATTEKDPKAGSETLPLGSDAEMLVYYGATLRISGTVRINDLTHLIINQAPYKEGDVFSLKTKDGTVKLKVVTIAPGELTLGLNEAVQVIKFKK